MPCYSTNTDPELTDWLKWAFESHEAGIFIRTLAEVALMADMPSYVLLRPVLQEFKQQNPIIWKSDIPAS